MSLETDYGVPEGSNLLYRDLNHITGFHAANSWWSPGRDNITW